MRNPIFVALLGLFVIGLNPAATAAERCLGKKGDVVGTSGKDKLKGTSGNDVIIGGDGTDRIDGAGGNDLICAGKGHDLVRGQAGNDQIDGGPGSDFLQGHDGDDVLVGAAGGDTLISGNGNDIMRAGSSAFDFLLGGAGDDTYDGGGGATDVASLENAPVGVTVDLGIGTPQNSGEGLDTFLGVEGLVGSEFNDVIRGHDVVAEVGNGLFGLDGSDTLLGLEGNDFVVGGAGNDNVGAALDGGAGNDQVFGDEVEDFFLTTGGDDDLYGGTGDDFLDGGGNFTGPPTGDYGNGGPHAAGDECRGLEDATTTECERFSRTTSRATASWHALESVQAWLTALKRMA
ncbi:MAG: calcium-binding protein [Actinomycetota bacterium]